MVRSGLPENRPAQTVWPAATMIFVGPLGTGVGIAADVLADVAKLSHRAVTRRRDFTQLLPSTGAAESTAAKQVVVLQSVSFGDATHRVDTAAIQLAIAWDHASADAARAAGIEAEEWILVDPTSRPTNVPVWRRDLIADAANTARESRRTAEKSGPIQQTARALKAISRRTPFARELWQRVLKLHVPARRRRAAVADFAA